MHRVTFYNNKEGEVCVRTLFAFQYAKFKASSSHWMFGGLSNNKEICRTTFNCRIFHICQTSKQPQDYVSRNDRKRDIVEVPAITLTSCHCYRLHTLWSKLYFALRDICFIGLGTDTEVITCHDVIRKLFKIKNYFWDAKSCANGQILGKLAETFIFTPPFPPFLNGEEDGWGWWWHKWPIKNRSQQHWSTINCSRQYTGKQGSTM